MKKILVIFALVALVASPAMAAEWNFYGSARMTTFSNDVDPGAGGESDQDTTWGLQGNSRIGANVKAGDVTGRFEYGSGPNLRILWGEWNFGSGSLGVGQHYTPANYFPSNQVWDGDADLLPYGGVYRGRRPMLQLKWGTFKLAFVSPTAASDLGSGGDVDITWPQIEASYKFKSDMWYADVFGGYQTYYIDSAPAAAVDVGISSYVIGLNAGVTVGPAAIKASIWKGQNMGPYGFWITGDGNPGLNDAGTETLDNDSMGFLGVVTFKATDMLSFEAGYGALTHDRENVENDDDTKSYYVNAVITFAPGVFIVPEIGKVDYEEGFAGTDEGEVTYFGAKWQINF
jgi:hypothetical protein